MARSQGQRALSGITLTSGLIIAQDGLQIPHDAKEILFNDVPEEFATKAAELVVPNSRGVTEATISYVPWNDMPCTYIMCELDQALPAQVAQWLLVSGGVKCEIVSIQSGHSPYLSMPDRTAAIIRRAAGEKDVILEGVEIKEKVGEEQGEAGWVRQ